MSAKSARFYTLISIGAALATIALKFGAYWFTGSVGLLSDALESGINLIAALFAFWALSLAAKPPDFEHPFGHSKAEYFSSGLESALIVVAALSISVAACERLFNLQPLEQIGIGLGLSLIATAINAAVAWVLLRAGKRLNSITLRADAHHILTDVWTSVGVVIGILLVKLTGWLIIDPIIALLVAANIIFTGVKLLRETASALLDHSLSREDLRKITDIFMVYENDEIQFQELRTRQAGIKRFISFKIVVPGEWTVKRGHQLCEEIEQAIIDALPTTDINTHLEPKG
ncbi:cation diffusion facilitator family transporter [Gloeothece verrucosa]|uniref:Cation diffusion facilitator family transporter n=1 Tax=Gloeothece verrucosa (strain PCC 7822) TaxID=497965 RepID=E0U5V3_GLOV7|nr:cation diffusion facilitator family transporter [Gloeothece verrucosa]ADN15944.1 cation diffusion facilitator family transporter [Gloeothece verrucosa PCC 7822]